VSTWVDLAGHVDKVGDPGDEVGNPGDEVGDPGRR